MRIIDWSSDVCSSDLAVLAQRGVDAGDLHAQLRGADGGVVAGGAGADDDDVELLVLGRKSVETGKSVSVRVDFGGLRIIEKIVLLLTVSIQFSKNKLR